MERRLTYFLGIIATALIMSSCSSSRYSTSQLYEDDDIYYTAGDIYISEAEADQYSDYVSEDDNAANSSGQSQSNQDDYDYFNEDRGTVVNNYYGYGYHMYSPRRMYRPGWNFGYNSWGGSSFGFNYYPFSGGYVYGYTMWGNPIYDPFFDPFYSPWYGGYGWNCFNGYNPYNPYGWNNGWNSGWNNGWVYNDTGGNSNYHYGPRPTLQAGSGVNSNYTGGTAYSPVRIQQEPTSPITRPIPERNDNATAASSKRPVRPSTELREDRNTGNSGTRPSTNTTRPTRPSTDWDSLFERPNNNQTTRPTSPRDNGGSNGRTTPSRPTRPSNGNSTRPSSPNRGSGGTRPSSGSRSSGSRSSGSKKSSGSSRKR